MKKSSLVLSLLLVSASVSAFVPAPDEWKLYKNDNSIMIANLSANGVLLSLNCDNGKDSWIGVETTNESSLTNNKSELDATSPILEIMVKHKGEDVVFSPEALTFSGIGGQSRLEQFVNTVHESSEVILAVNGDVFIPFKGLPSKGFPKYQEVSKQCRSAL